MGKRRGESRSLPLLSRRSRKTCQVGVRQTPLPRRHHLEGSPRQARLAQTALQAKGEASAATIADAFLAAVRDRDPRVKASEKVNRVYCA